MTRSDLIEIIARAMCPCGAETHLMEAGRITSALSSAGLRIVPKEALPDAIRRPMGVIPDSAVGYVTVAELDAAERRRAMVAAEDIAK